MAVDQASVDLVNGERALSGSSLSVNTAPGEDKIKGLYPKVEWQTQLDYAEEMGIGSRVYDLIKI